MLILNAVGFQIRPNVDKNHWFLFPYRKGVSVSCLHMDYIYTFALKSEIYCTMKYGELIKERRAVLGLTQQDLSDYTELSLRIIKSVESEKGNPSLRTLEKIADVLGLELIMRVKIINE